MIVKLLHGWRRLKNNMLIREFYRTRDDGVNLYKTYSDSNFYIQQIETGRKYASAIDIESSTYTYIETTEQIKPKEVRYVLHK